MYSIITVYGNKHAASDNYQQQSMPVGECVCFYTYK
jgi:hypothetical protein